ncbi:probable ATP-dependent RNA helicase DDX46 isoform X1 [Photinus pyralis]|uniref:probable ATP-dependent RNA helicase DDX46 isoform X1 n=1 Tax=Photinus pyralis TaxID=7054 RepID=UPI00126710D0|nr:probable ATP-dependent RNA helicase DDX46 isoform X1 [Photinus pyralis]
MGSPFSSSTPLYGDLTGLPLGDRVVKVNPLEEEKLTLLDHIKKLENDIAKLCKELTLMKENECILKKNISELFNTAKVENERNLRRIDELQDELDNFRFRRGTQSMPERKRSREQEQVETKRARPDRSPDRSRCRDYKPLRSIDRHHDRFRTERERSNSADRRRSRERDHYRHQAAQRPGRNRENDRLGRNVKVDRCQSDNLKIEIRNERASYGKEEDERTYRSEDAHVASSEHKMKDELPIEVSLNSSASKRRRCVIKMIN